MRTVNKEKVFDYLDALRESGKVNMLGATWNIVYDFIIPYADAQKLLVEWMLMKTKETQSSSENRPDNESGK